MICSSSFSFSAMFHFIIFFFSSLSCSAVLDVLLMVAATGRGQPSNYTINKCRIFLSFCHRQWHKRATMRLSHEMWLYVGRLSPQDSWPLRVSHDLTVLRPCHCGERARRQARARSSLIYVSYFY